ncbi:MAG: mechanosensitive ion channel family protein [Solirubrobacterales bacterium]
MPLTIAQTDQQVVSESLTTADWVVAAAVLVGSVIAAQIVNRLVARAVEGAGGDERIARAVGRWVAYAIVLGGVVTFLVILGVRLGPLLATFAALGVAIAFALQDDLRNLWSGIQIQTRRPFKLGDEIATGEWQGTVEAVTLRATTLRTRDGKQVLIPNANVMLRGIDNRTVTPTRRTTLTVGVAYDTDLKRAQRVLVDALGEVEEVEGLPEPTAFVEEFGESTINFAVRFWHGAETPAMWRARSAAAIAIKDALDAAEIEIAFPQRTVWIQNRPGRGDRRRES